ncbi:hypothetical protein [Vibrio sinaloensis]|uniref:hypothetical protein n=1 Tax=Photobacterium sp. (strain ATCC 43367) TaxID=379097 RepID=UPI0035EB1347
MTSEAYKKGLLSNLSEEYVNPYPEDSTEFDDYERGRSQKIKRSGSESSFSGFGWYCDEEPEKMDHASEILSEFSPYSRAKGK